DARGAGEHLRLRSRHGHRRGEGGDRRRCRRRRLLHPCHRGKPHGHGQRPRWFRRSGRRALRVTTGRGSNRLRRGRGRPRPLLFLRVLPRIPRSRETRSSGPADRSAMNATLSTRQVRVVGLLVLVVVAAGAYFVTKHKSSTPTTASSTPAATTPAHTTPGQTTPTPSKAHANTATPVKLNTYGMPVAVARAFRKHSVVVVSLTSPGSNLDSLAAAAARA